MALVILSVAHTTKAPGASTPSGLVVENPFSVRTCAAAGEHLAALGVDVRIIRGTLTQKIKTINASAARCVVEPHLNGAEFPGGARNPGPRGYGGIHWHRSVPSRNLAIHLSDAYEVGFHDLRYDAARRLGAMPCPGPFVRLPDLPLLSKTTPPAVIMESLFTSNPADAAWLEQPDSAEILGGWIARGVVAWLEASR